MPSNHDIELSRPVYSIFWISPKAALPPERIKTLPSLYEYKPRLKYAHLYLLPFQPTFLGGTQENIPPNAFLNASFFGFGESHPDVKCILGHPAASEQRLQASSSRPQAPSGMGRCGWW